MNQDTNLPNIKPEVNREEKKRSGLAALLLRLGIGSEAGTGAAGTGALGNILSAGVSGGILATKAGIIGLVLVGTTVAGSLGVVAYKLFGPQASDRADAGYSSLFSPKPQGSAAMPDGEGSASANGSSRSLQFLADANTKASGAAPVDAAASAAPADAAAASASVAAPSAPKNDNAFGSTIAKLKTDKQIGGLTKGAASGSGGSVSMPTGGASPSSASLLASANRGNLGGMSNSRAGGGKLGSLRSRGLGGGAARQLASVRRDHSAGPTSSHNAGHTYQGSGAMPSQITPADSGLSASPQDTAPDQTPGVNPSGSASNQFPEEPPTVGGTNVTPWQAAINTAMLAIVGAGLLLMIAGKVGEWAATNAWSIGAAQALITTLCVLAAGLGAYVVSLGAEIGGGKFGQPLQGGLLSLAGGMIIATSSIMAISAFTSAEKGMEVDAWSKKFMSGDTTMLMYLCGGAALAATAWAYMAPKNKYDSGLFKDGRPPDYDHDYEAAQVVTPPSQGILDQYLA